MESGKEKYSGMGLRNRLAALLNMITAICSFLAKYRKIWAVRVVIPMNSGSWTGET